MADKILPVLGKAEILTSNASYISTAGPKKDIRSYEEARTKIKPYLENILNELDSYTRLDNSIFFCMDLDSSYVAKSYLPVNWVNKSNWNIVGSISWEQKYRDKTPLQEKKKSRRLFIKSSPQNIESTLKRLDRSDLIKSEQKEIIRIDSFHFQESNKVTKFADSQFSDETFELIFHPMEQREWQECLKKIQSTLLSENYPLFLFNWVRSGGVDAPRFMPAKIKPSHITKLAAFNPLRSMRVMPSISFPRISSGELHDTNQPPDADPMRMTLPEIGMFDGGVDLNLTHLGPWVVEENLTTEPPDDEYLLHGTAVCGALFYGPYDPNKSYAAPKFGVRSFRVFPVPPEHGISLDLYKIVDWIEETVANPVNYNIKTYVLSFGPNIPVEDDDVDLFTSTLDRLAYEYDVLFIIAAGNDGNKTYPRNRIQPPSDMVNGIGVGAYIRNPNGDPVRADYSCVGPGRCGNAIKPDIHMFGGDRTQPFNILVAGEEGKYAGVQGTSFAAPLACSFAGELLYRVNDKDIITPQTVKALLIHNSFLEGWEDYCGWGPLTAPLEELLLCSQNCVTLIYNGHIPFGRRGVLRIPFYNDVLEKGKVQFRWTLVHATGISPAMPDEYSLAGTDVTFRPHCDMYSYRINDSSPKRIDIFSESEKVEKLRSNGAKISSSPKSDTVYKFDKRLYLTEQERRDIGVWDTAKHYWTKTKLFKSVKNPMIDIHAQARSDWHYGASKPSGIIYSAIVTIDINNADAELYQKIRTEIPALVPVRLRSRAQIRI